MAYTNSTGGDGVFGTQRPSASDDMGMFSEHPRSGAWATEKGTNINPWHQTADMEPDNEGPDRLNQMVSGTGTWDQHVIVTTGMTGGGGTMAH